MLIKVKVKAESKNEQILKLSEDSFSVKVKEKADRGLANQKVKEILALYFKVSAGKIKLVKGGKKPGKIFEILK